MTRYRLTVVENYRGETLAPSMIPHETGEWVKFDDLQPPKNTVLLELPAAWYAVLMQELQFGMSVLGGVNGHSPKNCERLFALLTEQGGATYRGEGDPSKWTC